MPPSTSRWTLALLAALTVCAAVASASQQIHRTRRPSHDKYVACYFQSWSIYRNGEGAFQIEDLRAEHCTHLIYAFAGLSGSSFTIRSLDHWADLSDHNGKDGYRKLTLLRYQNPGLKVSLAIGGWNEGSFNYSQMAKDPNHRKRFVFSVIDFLRAHNFQGLDLDWEFPTDRGGADYDKYNFLELLEELKRAFKPHGFLLTVAISADTEAMRRRYDVRKMSQYVDYIHLMTYDYHVLEGEVVMPNAPLDEVNKTLNHLLDTGVKPYKLILGLPTYGRAFILTESLRSPDENPIGKQSSKSSWSGPFSNQEGFLGYNEICRYLRSNQTWTDRWDNLSSTPYLVFQNRVIVYDSARSLQIKVNLAMRYGLGGVMVWSIDTDDFRGDCAPPHHRLKPVAGHGEEHEGGGGPSPYPLMRAIASALERRSSGSAPTTTALPLGGPLTIMLLALTTALLAELRDCSA